MIVEWPVNPNATIIDGVWRVGSDIQPGLYRTVPPERDFGGCYWARLADLSGTFDAIIASGYSDSPVYVEIEASDAAFEATDCGIWSKVEE